MFDDIIGKKRKCCICDKEMPGCAVHESFKEIVCSVPCAMEWIKRQREKKEIDSGIIDDFEKKVKEIGGGLNETT